MSRLIVRIPAGEGEIFAPDALRPSLGKHITVYVDDAAVGSGRVVGAEIVDDGHAAMIELDTAVPEALIMHGSDR